jgi:hypothetical protein
MDNFKNISIPPKEEKIPWTKKNDNHKHELTLIERNNKNFYWRCDKCLNSFAYNDSSYYCSLCDYDLCINCFNGISSPVNQNMNSMIGQMNPMIGQNMNPMIGQFQIPMMRNPFMDNLDQFVNPFKYCNMRKPVIYLYPEKPMNIKVKLNLKNSSFTVVYPKFNDENGWKAQASPNGDILINDKKYPYLFWEAKSYNEQEMNEGFVINTENAQNFLEEKLKFLGLNEKESTDFITYWLPVLYKNKLSLCTFQVGKFFENYELNITPKPETIIRIFLSIKKINSPIEINEQKLNSIERKGFTVVEWGGSNLE